MTATIPRCCPGHRLRTLNLLGELLAIDTLAAVGEMVGKGWPIEEAVEAYRRWMVGRLAGAVDVGANLARGVAEFEREYFA